MSTGEFVYLLTAISAFLAFAIVLGSTEMATRRLRER